MPYAENTTVPAAKSRAEIEHTLERFGATAFAYATEAKQATVAFDVRGLSVIFRLPMPDRNARQFTTPGTAQRDRGKIRRGPRRHRLAAVEAGITTIEDEFLAHIALPDGGTVGDHARPAIAHAYATGEMPQLMPGSN